MSIITRDIIKDLLPLYVAGEVSAESRAAVEEALRHDADLRELAAALGDTRPPATPAGPVQPDRDALRRVKKHLRLRTWLIAIAISSGLMPFAVVIDKQHGMRILFPDTWMVFATIAAVCIALILVLNRRS